MNVGQTPPYRVTKQELRAIGRNTDRALAGNPKSPACPIARMQTKMYLTHAGVPDDQHIQAATEASYRTTNIFRQQRKPPTGWPSRRIPRPK